MTITVETVKTYKLDIVLTELEYAVLYTLVNAPTSKKSAISPGITEFVDVSLWGKIKGNLDIDGESMLRQLYSGCLLSQR